MVDIEHVPGNSSGSHLAPIRKLVLHTTEGATVEGAYAAYEANNSWPHDTIDCRFGRPYRICSHLDYVVAARSLRNLPGGVETNRAGVIQVELVGFATRPSDIDWAWLGEHYVGPVCRNLGIPIQSTVRWVAYPASYGLAAAQRLSPDSWMAYQGILGHEHVPENTHGDPGYIPISTLLAAASPPPTTRRSGSKVLDSTTSPDGKQIDMVGIGPDRRVFHYTGTTVDGYRASSFTVLPGVLARAVSLAWVEDSLVCTLLGNESDTEGDGIAVWTSVNDGTGWSGPVKEPAAKFIDPAKV